MEIRGAMKESTLVLILLVGCILSTISIITSVDYLFKEGKYFELGFATIAFTILILVARQLKVDFQRLQEIEELEKFENAN